MLCCCISVTVVWLSLVYSIWREHNDTNTLTYYKLEKPSHPSQSMAIVFKWLKVFWEMRENLPTHVEVDKTGFKENENEKKTLSGDGYHWQVKRISLGRVMFHRGVRLHRPQWTETRNKRRTGRSRLANTKLPPWHSVWTFPPGISLAKVVSHADPDASLRENVSHEEQMTELRLRDRFLSILWYALKIKDGWCRTEEKVCRPN